jgi:hypothetical protein
MFHAFCVEHHERPRLLFTEMTFTCRWTTRTILAVYLFASCAIGQGAICQVAKSEYCTTACPELMFHRCCLQHCQRHTLVRWYCYFSFNRQHRDSSTTTISRTGKWCEECSSLQHGWKDVQTSATQCYNWVSLLYFCECATICGSHIFLQNSF